MMEMMENHADFGPLRVYRDPPDLSMPEKVDIVIPDMAYDPRRDEDEAYVPETLTVKAGTTVTWRNDDTSSHTVTEHEYEWTSPLLNPGESWSYTFNEPGVYDYHCNPHLWMVGTIVVE
jgi:plastocyanin